LALGRLLFGIVGAGRDADYGEAFEVVDDFGGMASSPPADKIVVKIAKPIVILRRMIDPPSVAS